MLHAARPTPITPLLPALVWLAVSAAGCRDGSPPGEPRSTAPAHPPLTPSSASPPAVRSAPASSAVLSRTTDAGGRGETAPSPRDASSEEDAAADGDAEADGGTEAAVANVDALRCPTGMLPVEGDYCPDVEQRCLEYETNKAGKPDKRRCKRFAKPSRCLSPRRMQLRFCMDRYEYPNRRGARPLTLVSWRKAKELCEAQGKRLCTEFEFNFACEGEQMLPYATGFERPPESCNLDQPVDHVAVKLQPHDRCQADPTCAEQFAKLDQRDPSGAHPRCRSVFGIEDLNGNVNEWVSFPFKKPPRRSALKGGWWGPVRNRCRPIALSHNELYIGYEVGFRCCWGALPGKRKWSAEKR